MYGPVSEVACGHAPSSHASNSAAPLLSPVSSGQHMWSVIGPRTLALSTNIYTVLYTIKLKDRAAGTSTRRRGASRFKRLRERRAAPSKHLPNMATRTCSPPRGAMPLLERALSPAPSLSLAPRDEHATLPVAAGTCAKRPTAAV